VPSHFLELLRRRFAWAAFSVIAALPSAAHAQARQPQSGSIEGIVAAQRGTIALGGAQVAVADATGKGVASLLSDADGRFRIANLAPGTYTITVTLPGFDIVRTEATVIAGRPSALTIDLPIATLTDTIDVVAPPTIVSSAETLGSVETIDSKELDQYVPGGGLQSALRLLAGVIDVPSGLSIKGGRPTQAGMQIGAITLADPALGLVQLQLPDDAIDSVSVLPNPYAVEYGRFSSGLVLIRTRRAGDSWRIRLNNLEPTLRTKRHQDWRVTGLSGFAPRLETGGPLVKDRLFLEQTAQYRYSSDELPSRPEDERRTTHWISSFTRADAVLTPRHSLSVSGGFFPSRVELASLGTFVPPEATVDRHERVNHVAFTERTLWRDTLVGESAVQVRASRIETRPQGQAPMELRPDTTGGNFYNTQRRTPLTIQAIETLASSVNLGATGLHLIKVGVDVLHGDYQGTSASRPMLMYRSDGRLVRRLDFTGPTEQSVSSTDVAFFAQDRMQPSGRWYLEYGVRLDRDGVLAQWNVTPRAGAAVLLNADGTSVLRGGSGLFYERTPSVAGAFRQFESAIDTRYAGDGMTPVGVPMAYRHVVVSPLRTARSATWDLAYDYRVNPKWSFQASIVHRRGSNELIVDPAVLPGQTELRLSSAGRSRYRAMDVGFQYTHSEAADLNVTYAHAEAHSDLNDFAHFFNTMPWPIVGPNAYGVSGTDVPHRLIARGKIMPHPRWLLVGIANWRTGLPYSVIDEAHDFVGTRNSRRMPNFMRLDLGVEHRFHILRWKPWIGIRAYNALNSFLPSDVQANIGSPNFGGLYNSDYRQLRLQVRFER
jgi:hypothetical protein